MEGKRDERWTASAVAWNNETRGAREEREKERVERVVPREEMTR